MKWRFMDDYLIYLINFVAYWLFMHNLKTRSLIVIWKDLDVDANAVLLTYETFIFIQTRNDGNMTFPVETNLKA